MTNEISINTIGDAVRERVKKAIFDSIPDEAIETLIKSELESMTSKKDKWGHSRDKSPLEELLATEIKKQLSEKTKEAVTKYIDDTYINQSKELVDAAIKEMAPVFMASMMEKFSQMAVNDLKYTLQNKGIYL